MLLISFACLALFVQTSANTDHKVQDVRSDGNTSKNEMYVIRGFDWIGDKVLELIDDVFMNVRDERSMEGRKHKHKKSKLGKYLLPLLVGFLMVKSILVPMILKALAIISSKAILLSFLSLILSAIIGLRQLAFSRQIDAQGRVDVVNVPVTKYRRKDHYANQEDPIEDDSYVYYTENRRSGR